MSVSQEMHERLLKIDLFAARGKIRFNKEVITMFWDFFDDDLDLEDFAIIGGIGALIEEEEEERRRRELEEDTEEDSYPY